jgi:hypothetical protein
MSAEGRRKIEIAALVVGTLLALLSAGGVFFVLPYRMSAAESAIAKIQEQRVTDHDVLTRIDARTEEMQRTLARLDRQKN